MKLSVDAPRVAPKWPPLSTNLPGQHWTDFPRNSLYLDQKKSRLGFLWTALEGELVVKGGFEPSLAMPYDIKSLTTKIV